MQKCAYLCWAMVKREIFDILHGVHKDSVSYNPENLLPKRDSGAPILNTLSEASLAIFQHARDQQVFAYNCKFISSIQSYHCKQVPAGFLHAEKINS